MMKTNKRPLLLIVLFTVGLVYLSDLATAETKSGSEFPKQVDQAVDKVDEVINLEQVGQKATHLGVKIFATVFVILLAVLLSRIGAFILNLLAERAARFRSFKKIGPVYQTLIWFFAVYAIIDWILDPSAERLFAFFAASGVAIGFASQDILKNVFGGIMIIFDRPFQIGDKIRVGEYYGEVTNIGLRTTRIVTPDDSMVSIPNSEVVSKAVSNANSGELDCQVVTEIDIPSSIDLAEARTIAWEAAVTSQYVYLKKPVSVVVQDAPSDHVIRTKLKIKAYVVDTRLEFVFSTDIAEAVKEEFRKRGWIPKRLKQERELTEA